MTEDCGLMSLKEREREAKFTWILTDSVNLENSINTSNDVWLPSALHSNKTFSVARVVKNTPANTRDVRDAGSIPGSGRSPGGGNSTPVVWRIVWRIPWAEEPGGLQSTGLQRIGYDWSDLAQHASFKQKEMANFQKDRMKVITQ